MTKNVHIINKVTNEGLIISMYVWFRINNIKWLGLGFKTVVVHDYNIKYHKNEFN